MEKTIEITVKEVLKRTVSIEADNVSDAVQKANEMYDNEEIVLDYEDLYSTDVLSADEDENPFEDLTSIECAEILNLLESSFVDIDFKYANLTNIEKMNISERTFNKLTNMYN